ncbi:MAG: signal peptidase II, partial [Flavobacteriales bacterium]|nr:signal peptidase II [Flavobacteriales bacterium]
MLKKSILLITIVLLLDQVLKVWIKTNMMIGQEIHFFDWFIIHFTENKGMAFGMEFGGSFGKYLLSIFRLVAIVAIAIYLKNIATTDVKKGVVLSISLVLAGAIGNMIDSAFYGLVFSESYGQLATVFEGGYAGFLQGKVVDMFYFPLING